MRAEGRLGDGRRNHPSKGPSAAQWCKHATAVSSKPWKYLLIPHTAVEESKSWLACGAVHSRSGDMFMIVLADNPNSKGSQLESLTLRLLQHRNYT